jgi:hypothetical protein
MSLILNYGISASTGSKTVVAAMEVPVPVSSSTATNIPLTYLDNTLWNGVSNNDFALAWANIPSNAEIIYINNSDYWNNAQIFTGTYPNGTAVYNSNSTKPTQITVPTGATHIQFLISKTGPFAWHPGSPTTFAQLQQLRISYSEATSPTTTTFYDEYPNGNIIGTTEGTTVGDDLFIDPPQGYKIRQIVLLG